MSFRLVDSGWDGVLDSAVRVRGSDARIICPFIKLGAARRLLSRGSPENMRVITRFNLDGFYAGVSDIAALRLLLEGGAHIRGIRNLHAKLYLFGARKAIVTSANLTEAALLRNHEFGFVAEDEEIGAACARYFDRLWKHAGQDLRPERLDEWGRRIEHHLLAGGPPTPRIGLGDEGADVGLFDDAPVRSGWPAEAGQAFVKFFGKGDNRAERSLAVLDEVTRSGCHWACTYSKRPKQVNDGALMFMGRLVKRPNDVLVYGRAVGLRHQPGRDEATAADLLSRPQKAQWPYYVRVHHAEFVAGALSNGVSLFELMDTLGPDAFASTQRNAAAGFGNTNPRSAIKQQPSVELSPQGLAWLNERMQHAFDVHGTLPPEVLGKLDWPTPDRNS